MAKEMDFLAWQVPELKDHLHKRGIACSLHRKHDLVKLCELSEELKLEVLPQDDYHDMNEKRRAVQIGPDTVILEDISSIKLWTRNLTALPDIENCDILVYFFNACGWTEERLMAYKKDNGYALFLANHINDVEMAVIPGSQDEYMYIRSTCIPETRQQAIPYTAWIIVNTDGQIKSGGCTCVADNGTCKHCVALLFSLTSFCDRHKDRHTQVGTDVECKWDKPRKTSQPMEIDDIDIRIDQSTPAPLYATPANYNAAVNTCLLPSRQIEKEMYMLCQNTNALLLQTLDPPSDASDSEEGYPLTLSDIANNLKCQPNAEELLMEQIKSVYDNDTIKEIEELTRGQSDNLDWFSYRKGRVTASSFPSIMHFRFGDNDNNYILKKIMSDPPNPVKFKQNPDEEPDSPMEFGKYYEPVARQQYTEMYKRTHKQAKVTQCGLFIYSDDPCLGASPDGVVSCKCCGKGILEIKCSFTHRDKTPEEACQDNHYHVRMNENNEVELKLESPWYIQIQGQLGVCKMEWCDFAFFTKKGFNTERIYFDADCYKNIVKKSNMFFKRYIVKSLLK